MGINFLLAENDCRKKCVGDSYGLGSSPTQTGGVNNFGHGGANEGFRCAMLAHKTAGVAVVTCSDNGEKLLDKIIDLNAERDKWPEY